MYYPQANGLAEAFNKTFCNLMKKTVKKSRKDLPVKMEEALWAYRTTFRTATQTTPYALFYGTQAVLPFEVKISSLRVAVNEEPYPSGANMMTHQEGKNVGPINGHYLKRYYP
ncbi:hypothetical protein LIER_25920 [Lithospermum erythrorhizon]|uniref:Integrase catalytic domain-containing protein n=1 Tax=Lithospermum erythrorhizon TaxID=34254 RepID=A0AAV3RA84_LITER